MDGSTDRSVYVVEHRPDAMLNELVHGTLAKADARAPTQRDTSAGLVGDTILVMGPVEGGRPSGPLMTDLRPVTT